MYEGILSHPMTGTSAMHEKMVNGTASDAARDAATHAQGRQNILDKFAAVAAGNVGVTVELDGRDNSKHYAGRQTEGVIAVVRVIRRWVCAVQGAQPTDRSYRVRLQSGNRCERWAHPCLFPPGTV